MNSELCLGQACVQVVNSTQYVLEVCLITVEDDDWQEVAPRAGTLHLARNVA